MPKLTLWQRLRIAYDFLRRQEPVRVQAFWKALIGVLIAAGVTVPDWLDARVSAVIAAVYVVLMFWNAASTRARVVPIVNVPRELWSETRRNPDKQASPPL